MTPKRILAALAATLALAGPAAAQDFPDPNRTMTIIAPYAAGGGVDFVCRTIAAKLQEELGIPVNVENRPGASAQLGLTELVQAKPDGYTLAMMVMPTVLTHFIDKSRGAIYTRDSFQPIAHLYSVSYGIAVPADSPYQDFQSFVEAAKADPGAIRVSDAGLMSSPHIFLGLVKQQTGAGFQSVHFDGGAPAMAALLGHHVEAMTGGGSDFVPQMGSGQMRVLAVSTEGEDPRMPGIPSMKSLGYDVLFSTASGLVAPAGVPEATVAKLDEVIAKIAADEDYRKALLDYGITPDYKNASDYGAYLKTFEADVGPVVEKLLAEGQ